MPDKAIRVFIIQPNSAVCVFDWLQMGMSLPLRRPLWPFVGFSMDMNFQLHG